MDPFQADEILFNHLVAEFGDRGNDAVAFLQTGQALVDVNGPALPRQAAAAAYCLREALKRLLPPEPDLWARLTADLVDSKLRYDAVRTLPGGDERGALNEVLAAIDRLAEFKNSNEGKNVRRLARLVEARTGTSPFPFALQQYQQLLRQLDSVGVHGSISMEEVRDLHGKTLAVLRLVFGPFHERQGALDELAELHDPVEADVERLLSICSGPHHLTYFMRRALSPTWLQLLTPSGILDPPTRGGIWATDVLLERLAVDHRRTVAEWLNRMYKSCGKSEVAASYLASAARRSLPDASVTLVRALRDYPASHWIRGQAALALEGVDVSSDFVEKVAAVLLESAAPGRDADFAEEAASALVEGLNQSNALSRVRYLVRGLAANTESSFLASALGYSGSVETVDDDGSREAGALLQALLAAIRRCRELEVRTADVLLTFEELPAQLRTRVRAWTLTGANDVTAGERVSEIARAVQERRPFGDAILLIDAITSVIASEVWVGPWKEALGAPPQLEIIGAALSVGEVAEQWHRARLWYPLLPADVRSAWDGAVLLMSPVLPAPSRDFYLSPPPTLQLESARSPLTKAELEALEVSDAARKIAAWRPSGNHMTLARELGRTLEDVVSDAPMRWAENALETIVLLRHPTYLHHYFAGLTKTSADLSELGPRILEAVTVAMTHPWSVVPLGGDDFDYDQSWIPVDEACVDLIGKLAERNVSFGSRDDDAWKPVFRAVRDRSATSRISRRDDPLETAINRPCTRALQAMFQLMGADFRRDGLVRPEALELLDDILTLRGWDGAEHRAIIAPRLGFLLHVATNWVEQREPTLFGPSAPDDLGQTTIDLALKWGRPNRWLLERHREAVMRAVRRSVERAMDHAMVGVLWSVPGYSIPEVVTALFRIGPSRISEGGESLAKLLRSSDDPSQLEIGIDFWTNVIAADTRPAIAYKGFGWWADVDQMDKERWETLTKLTCERANGSLALSHRVAERAATTPVTAAGLSILTSLLRGPHEYWDRSYVAETANRALAASKSEPMLAEARERLGVALNDYGFFEHST